MNKTPHNEQQSIYILKEEVARGAQPYLPTGKKQG